MKNSYSQHIVIPCYQTDSAKMLKPASFMDLAQEAANRHADILGFGYDDLSETKTLWVLSRMHVIFHRHPVWREEVDLLTWHKGPSKMFYLRDFRLTDKDGLALVEATTSWLVIDASTRRIVRGTALMADESDGAAGRDDAIADPCVKVQMPREAHPELVGKHRVSYSDVDLNGHSNNAMYVVWAMDAVDYDMVSSRPLREMKINFSHETRPGDVVELYLLNVPEEDGSVRCIVEGRTGDRQAFCVELLF